MRPKITHEEFLRRSREKHGNKYNYDSVVFRKASEKVEIICPVHGSFIQQASVHATGAGCQRCAGKSILNKEDFILRATQIHNGRYKYSKVVYEGVEKKVEITCKIHGSFWQTPSAHIKQKQNCPSCANDKAGKWKIPNTNVFMDKAKKVHGDKYDYSRVEYKRSNQAVEILCNHCEEYFHQTPNAHLAGKGCRSCNLSGFTYSKSAYLYVLKCEDTIKVGITNKTPQDRARDVSRSSGKEFHVYESFNLLRGCDALQIENELLAEMREEYTRPPEKFNGYTECFVNVDVQDLLKRINDKLSDKELVE